MSDIIDPPAEAAKGDAVQRLKPNAVGLIGVLFMAVATAAPITAMVGNVPIASTAEFEKVTADQAQMVVDVQQAF